jgi:hypothetical protein
MLAWTPNRTSRWRLKEIGERIGSPGDQNTWLPVAALEDQCRGPTRPRLRPRRPGLFGTDTRHRFARDMRRNPESRSVRCAVFQDDHTSAPLVTVVNVTGPRIQNLFILRQRGREFEPVPLNVATLRQRRAGELSRRAIRLPCRSALPPSDVQARSRARASRCAHP